MRGPFFSTNTGEMWSVSACPCIKHMLTNPLERLLFRQEPRPLVEKRETDIIAEDEANG